MNKFKKGDVLLGKNRKREGACHPVVFFSGPDEAPFAIVLTHSRRFPCNIALSGKYDEKPSYFIAHLIEKMGRWGPYKKVSKLNKEDMRLIESHISDLTPITWDHYEKYTKSNCCPKHKISRDAV